MKWNEIVQMDTQTAGEHPAVNNEPPIQAKRILIPLDLVHGTIEPLVFVQGLAAEVPLCATLLHVVEVNLSPLERRIYDELCSEAQAALSKLARLFFGGGQETRVSVRIGRPHEQIVIEARSSRCELIIMSGGQSRSWARLFRRGTTGRVVRTAPCPTLVLPLGRPLAQFLPSAPPAGNAQAAQWAEVQRRGSQASASRFGEESMLRSRASRALPKF